MTISLPVAGRAKGPRGTFFPGEHVWIELSKYVRLATFHSGSSTLAEHWLKPQLHALCLLDILPKIMLMQWNFQYAGVIFPFLFGWCRRICRQRMANFRAEYVACNALQHSLLWWKAVRNGPSVYAIRPKRFLVIKRLDRTRKATGLAPIKDKLWDSCSG